MAASYQLIIKVNDITKQAAEIQFDENVQDIRTTTLKFPMVLGEGDIVTLHIEPGPGQEYTVSPDSHFIVRFQPHF